MNWVLIQQKLWYCVWKKPFHVCIPLKWYVSLLWQGLGCTTSCVPTHTVYCAMDTLNKLCSMCPVYITDQSRIYTCTHATDQQTSQWMSLSTSTVVLHSSISHKRVCWRALSSTEALSWFLPASSAVQLEWVGVGGLPWPPQTWERCQQQQEEEQQAPRNVAYQQN